MNISEHTRILKAYIDRLPLAELEKIMKASHRTWHEQLNGNANSQEDADFKLYATIMNGLGNMLTHDRHNITTIVSNIVRREDKPQEAV